MGEETEIDSAAEVIHKRVSTPLHGELRIDSGAAPHRGVWIDRLIGQYNSILFCICSFFSMRCPCRRKPMQSGKRCQTAC